MSSGDPSRRLHPIEASELHARRERVFLILAGTFLGAMAMLNILGITKFIHLGPLQLAVGVLPYPLTFLATDFISELYGRARANFVVFAGLIVNVLVLAFIWAGSAAPSIEFRTPLQRIVTLGHVGVSDEDGMPVLDPATGAPLVRPAVPELDEAGHPVLDANGREQLRPVQRFSLEPVPGGPAGALRLTDADTGQPVLRDDSLFDRIAASTRAAVLASMIAYLFAQFVDVYLFHFWKRVTRGRHLWLRNNGSTMVSQLVDTVCVVLVTFWASIAAGEVALSQVMAWIGGGYAFKVMVALLDTIPFYLGVGFLSRYLEIDPRQEHAADSEELILDEPGRVG